MLELRDISKKFSKLSKEIEVLNGVKLSLDQGEFVAVQGPSGCGKTTLLLIAGGLLNPDRGTIFLDGEDIYLKNSDQRASLRAHNFGFVFQQYHLIPYLTILENILLPSLALSKHNITTRAFELMEKFGLTERTNHIPGELSAGEKQRTSLARAMLCNPRILFADEITGNLDDDNSGIVINVLREFAKEGGSVLFVTHDHDMARSADRVMHLVNGKLKWDNV